jgi:hypothetical protein
MRSCSAISACRCRSPQSTPRLDGQGQVLGLRCENVALLLASAKFRDARAEPFPVERFDQVVENLRLVGCQLGDRHVAVLGLLLDPFHQAGRPVPAGNARRVAAPRVAPPFLPHLRDDRVRGLVADLLRTAELDCLVRRRAESLEIAFAERVEISLRDGGRWPSVRLRGVPANNPSKASRTAFCVSGSSADAFSGCPAPGCSTFRRVPPRVRQRRRYRLLVRCLFSELLFRPFVRRAPVELPNVLADDFPTLSRL